MLANPLPWIGHVEFAAEPQSVARARRATLRTLQAWHLEHLADVAALLVSELVTNAVKTAGANTDANTEVEPGEPSVPSVADGTAEPDDAAADTPSAHVSLDLRYTGDVLSVEVWDPTRAGTPVLRDASEEDESGRGIFLVASLSKQWGCYAPRTGGKVVWCELSAHPDSADQQEESSWEPPAPPLADLALGGVPAVEVSRPAPGGWDHARDQRIKRLDATALETAEEICPDLLVTEPRRAGTVARRACAPRVARLPHG